MRSVNPSGPISSGRAGRSVGALAQLMSSGGGWNSGAPAWGGAGSGGALGTCSSSLLLVVVSDMVYSSARAMGTRAYSGPSPPLVLRRLNEGPDLLRQSLAPVAQTDDVQTP